MTDLPPEPTMFRNKQRLMEERDRLLRRRDALSNQIEGLDLAIRIVDAPPDRERDTINKEV